MSHTGTASAPAAAAAIPAPRTGERPHVAVETSVGETYLVTWLGRTACEAGYEPSRSEARQLARAFQDLADTAECA